MKKDILFLCQFFYPEYVTSALLPYQTSQELVSNGYSVDVLCGYPMEYCSKTEKGVPKRERVNGIEIRRVNYLQLNRTNTLFRLINYFSFVFSCLLKLFSLRQYRLIYVYSNPPILPIIAVLAHCLFKTQFVFVAYDIYPDIAIKTGVLRANSLISRLTSKINREVYKRASRIVALSTEMKEYLVIEKAIPESKVVVIPNWSTEDDINVFLNSQQSLRRTVSYLGNMGIPQDFDLIESIISNEEIQKLPIDFIFAGHGSRKNPLKEFVVANKLRNVKVYDYLQGKDYQRILEKSDYHLLSLKSDLNGLAVPSKFYSYINSGKPILALINEQSDIARDIRRYNLGFVISTGALDDILEIFRTIANDSPKHEILENRHFFAKEIQLNKYVKMTKEILKESRCV